MTTEAEVMLLGLLQTEMQKIHGYMRALPLQYFDFQSQYRAGSFLSPPQAMPTTHRLEKGSNPSASGASHSFDRN